MTITLEHILAAIVVSALALAAILYFIFRSSKTVYPVRCVHCWTHDQKETIISRSETPDQWGICPKCISAYWRFGEEDSGPES